jgi:hypothetical protein
MNALQNTNELIEIERELGTAAAFEKSLKQVTLQGT